MSIKQIALRDSGIELYENFMFYGEGNEPTGKPEWVYLTQYGRSFVLVREGDLRDIARVAPSKKIWIQDTNEYDANN